MENLKNYSSLILVVGVLILLSSCREEAEELADSIITSRDNSRAMMLWDDIYKVVDEEASSIDGIRSASMNTCIDTIIVDTLSNPKTITIDFGQDDCTSGFDGRVRKGMLEVSFTGRYRDPGTVITTTPINYSVNDYVINGVKTVTNQGLNENDQPYFTVEIEDATITAPNDEWTSSWESSRTRVWVEGFDSVLLLDDVYEVSGSQTGVNRNGSPYEATTLSPLRIEIGCPWIVSGIYSLTPGDLSPRTVDFGDGDCDANAVVTVNGNAYNFTLW